MVNKMKLNVSGLWKRVWPAIKVAGTWKLSKAVFVKVGGIWKQTVGVTPKNTVYNGTITVGSGTYDGAPVYGYMFYATGGNASPNVTKQGAGMYFITRGKTYLEAAPYYWAELCIQGDARSLDIGNCSINGVVGEFLNLQYDESSDVSYARWQFGAAVPSSGSWTVIV